MTKKELLNNIEQYIKENNYDIYDLVVSDNESNIEIRKIKEINFLPDSYSVAKAWTTQACGILYDEGKLDLNESITTILKEDINYSYNPIWDTLTVHDALKHHLGIENNYLDIDCDDPIKFGDDYLKYILQNAKFVYKPKIDYSYTDAAFYLISRIIYKKTNLDLCDFLKIKLFDDLNIKTYTWTKCPKGYSMGGTGLYMNSIDTVKLPTLLLNRGVYKGKQLLSINWINILEENQYENYLLDNDWYQKGGMANQIVMYNKKYNIAVSWHGHDSHLRELREFVIKIVTDTVK